MIEDMKWANPKALPFALVLTREYFLLGYRAGRYVRLYLKD
jgi:hypothetical protein